MTDADAGQGDERADAPADEAVGADAPADREAPGDGRAGADQHADQHADPAEPPPGLITVRAAAAGVALLWVAAMAGFGALQASMYAYRVAPEYGVVAVLAAALSLSAGYGSFRRFGLV